MPVLLASTQAPSTPLAPSLYADTRILWLEAPDGSRVHRESREPGATGAAWFIMPGLRGLGMPETRIIEQGGLGFAGSWVREVRVDARDVFVPIHLMADSHAAYNAALSELMDFVDPTRWAPGADGTLKLVATSTLGTREIQVMFVGGFEGVYGGTDSGGYWGTFGLTFRAPQPYWSAREDTSRSFRLSAGSVFLSRSEAYPWPRSISPTTVIGDDMPVVVAGEIPVWPSIDIVAPGSGVTVETSTGMRVVVQEILAGQATLATDPRRRRFTLNGESRWDLIGAGPQLRRLVPGANTVSVVMPGASGDSLVRVRWRELFRAAW